MKKPEWPCKLTLKSVFLGLTGISLKRCLVGYRRLFFERGEGRGELPFIKGCIKQTNLPENIPAW